jgi:hypothetical protein
METTIAHQNTKTFIWSMLDPKFIDRFERFNKLAMVKGIHVTTLLSNLVLEHIEEEDIPGTLVDEKQLLDELQNEQLSVSRVTLRNYRIHNKLVKDGKPIYFTDGRNVCYHLEFCLEFFRAKKKRNSLSCLRA